MLKFLVQTFYQPLFSHSFPSVILFPSKSFPHQKAQSQSQRQKPNLKGKKQKPQPSFHRPFIPSDKQGGAVGRGVML
jgi:hypothetical protein